MSSAKTVMVDVREDLRQGREPFSRIMTAVDALRPGQSLRLIAPLEPVPLMKIMANRGFTHTKRELGDGNWEVVFKPASASPPGPAPTDPPACPARPVERFIEVDTRGLEPPQPMVTILEALVDLPAQTGVRARTDRRPVHLYPHLEQRGFVGESTEQSDGSFLTIIRHA